MDSLNLFKVNNYEIRTTSTDIAKKIPTKYEKIRTKIFLYFVI